MLDISKKRLRHAVYLAGVFLSFHLALSAYVNSSFLLTFVQENVVGVIFSIASLGMIITLLLLPHIIDRTGNIATTRKMTLALIVVSFLLATNIGVGFAIPLFIAYYILGASLLFNLDLYLEHLTDNWESGQVRGAFSSFVHIAWFISPIIAGLLIGTESVYQNLYLISGVMLLPFLYLTMTYLPEVKDHYRQFSFWKAVKRFAFSQNIRDLAVHRILVVEFLVQFFHGIMIIYAPIYLNKVIGFSWPEIGLMFSIMLIPFFFQFWLGKIADEKLGEKEIIISAFLIAAVSLFVFGTITDPNIFIWGSVLLLGRVGLSGVDTMKETYLFKQIDADDIDVLVLSRNMRPIASIFAPLAGALFITFVSFNYLFVFLGLTMLFGMFYCFKLVDTR